jgi:hypothetical protein
MTVRRLRSVLRDADEAGRKPRLLPEGCPVTPLGTRQGLFFYLNCLGELRALTSRDHSKLNLVGLFSPEHEFLEAWHPRVNRDGQPTGDFAAEKVAKDLMHACAQVGVWSPDTRVRGRGAWLGRDGDLILHLGDTLYVRGRYEPCGMRDEIVYPVLRARPHPAEEREPGGVDGAAMELRTLLGSWSWARPKLDPMLLLGWIGAAMVGGALPWRPAVWITGDKGTGKSTLQDVLRGLFGDGEGIYSLADATEAAIRQRMKSDALPVAFDEAEAEEDNSRLAAVVKLARIAASGGTIMRGGADHEGAEFHVRFCTLYSSILHPPMSAQDRSRIAFLHLRNLPPGAMIRLDPGHLARLGRRLLRRIADRWPALTQGDAPILQQWQAELMARGLDYRGAAQFGTLLACADVLLHDHPPDGETLRRVAESVVHATDEDRTDELADWQRCIQHLVSSLAQAKWSGGEQRTIGTLIAIAAGRPVMADNQVATRGEREEAQAVLASYGLRVHPDIDGPDLAVANDHRNLAHLFETSHWRARSGASGVWRQALLRAPGARPSSSAVRFRGPQARAVLVPLCHVLGDDGAQA